MCQARGGGIYLFLTTSLGGKRLTDSEAGEGSTQQLHFLPWFQEPWIQACLATTWLCSLSSKVHSAQMCGHGVKEVWVMWPTLFPGLVSGLVLKNRIPPLFISCGLMEPSLCLSFLICSSTLTNLVD